MRRKPRRSQGRTAAQAGTQKWRARAKRVKKVERVAGVDRRAAKQAVQTIDKIEREMVQMLERHVIS